MHQKYTSRVTASVAAQRALYLRDSTILITGADGYIGHNLCTLLKEAAPDGRIIGVDRMAASGGTLQIDLLEEKDVADLISEVRPDHIFHLAGVIYSRDWEAHYKGNVETTINILEAVRGCRLRSRVVVPGSAAEYGRVSKSDLPITERQTPDPVSPYGVAKVWQTTVTRYYATNGVDAVTGRIFNVIGKGMPAGLSIGAFAGQLKKIRDGELPSKMMVGNLRPRRDFIDINDVCKGLIALAEKGVRGEAYNICSGRSVSMEEILTRMIKASGLDVEFISDPAKIKDVDIEDIFGTHEKLTRDTGWTPVVPLDSSIDDIVRDL